jgi:hypothetical protein
MTIRHLTRTIIGVEGTAIRIVEIVEMMIRVEEMAIRVVETTIGAEATVIRIIRAD